MITFLLFWFGLSAVGLGILLYGYYFPPTTTPWERGDDNLNEE